jgi:hypothetical protein
MRRVKINRAVGFTIGLLTFAGAHMIEVALWTSWFGGVYRPWFLNSGQAAAFTISSLFVVSLASGWLGIPGSFIAAGAFAATVLVLFVGGGGAGSIFPIALAGGALLIAAATLTGGWLGSEIRRSLDRRS